MVSTTFKPADAEKVKRARDKFPEKKDATIVREAFNLGFPLYMGEPGEKADTLEYVSIPTTTGKEIVVPSYEDGKGDLLAVKNENGYIIVRKSDTINDGSLVVAEIKGEVVIGRHYTKEGVVVLIKDSEADHPIITSPKTVKVYGVFHSTIKIK